MTKDNLKDLCSNYCSYFKPLKDEDLACRGFAVVQVLIEGGQEISFQKTDKRPSPETKEGLREVLCPACPFYADDCDFILQEGKAMPCGGFIFLCLLLDKEVISIDDVRNIE